MEKGIKGLVGSPDDDLPSNASVATILGDQRKPVGLLILTSDFIHNFVDGLAVGISFSVSFQVGLATSIAVFLHEIPHELGDFAILLAAGYPPRWIIISNLLTSLSAFLGVVVAVLLYVVDPGRQDVSLLNSMIQPSILSLTVGNFLYIALADLIPELLESTSHLNELSGSEERWIHIERVIQYVSLLSGVALMLLIKVLMD